MAETGWRSRIAARIAVEVEEEAELHPDSADRAGAVPRAVARVAAGLIRVDRVVRVRDRMVVRHVGDLLQHLVRRGRSGGRRRTVGGGAELGDARCAHVSRAVGVLGVGTGIRGAMDVRVEAVETGYLVAGECRVGRTRGPVGWGGRPR